MINFIGQEEEDELTLFLNQLSCLSVSITVSVYVSVDVDVCVCVFVLGGWRENFNYKGRFNSVFTLVSLKDLERFSEIYFTKL